MREILSSNKRYLVLLCFGVALVGIGIALLIAKPWEGDAPFDAPQRLAEAVMTTQPLIIDGLGDGSIPTDELCYPIGIAYVEGSLYIADSFADRIQIIGETGSAQTNAQIGKPGQYGLSYVDSGALVDGFREDALFMKPSDIAVSGGIIYVADAGNHSIRRIDDEFVLTVAGSGTAGYREGNQRNAMFNEPRGIAADGDYIYVADTMNHCIRRIDKDGNTSLLAGRPGASGFADGKSSDALFFEPCGLLLAPDGDLYIADSANHAIRKISGGNVTTVAGYPSETNEVTGYPEGGYADGLLSAARFNFPRAIAMLPNGAIAVADSMNHSVRMITNSAVITLVGGGMADAYYGSSENLKLSRPEGICTDGETLYISDTLGNRVVGVPINERLLNGRPSRGDMLNNSGVTLDSRHPYRGNIRIHIMSPSGEGQGEGKRVDTGRLAPWNTPDHLFIPIRPLFEALGGHVEVDDRNGVIYITINAQTTTLTQNSDYFVRRGIAVTTADEIKRLFPYYLEWYPEFSLIVLSVPIDLT